MKAFARLDVIIQVILIVSGLAIGLGVMAGSISGDFMFVPYFMVGGWQIFSVIVHLVGEGFRFSALRKAYLSTLILVVVVLIISIPTEIHHLRADRTAVLLSLMAFLYLYTCNKELKKLPGWEW